MSFRREKYVPRGGPDGGDGGRGGHVIFEAQENLHTLYDMGNHRKLKAGNGQPGGPGHCTGKNGPDLVVPVPIGTLVKDKESGSVLSDLSAVGERYLAAQGGRGGLGNSHFKTPVLQAPRRITPGIAGEHKLLELELKLVADCGLVGFPNAGKSSLIRKLSHARPKVADYPFTTIKPFLGVCVVEDGVSFVVADIPGLIEGAAEGKGLGHRFLRHIERTALLLFVLDPSQGEPSEQLEALLAELEEFHPALAQKPRMVWINKSDLAIETEAALSGAPGMQVLHGSALTAEGIPALKEALVKQLGSMGILDDKRHRGGW